MNDQGTAKNRRVRVFVSSTFRDMMEERDELMAQTWPELRRFCRERQVELTEVDLRWGITEEQGWLVELQDRSVTKLEILHSVLNSPEMAARAFFNFRDPAYSRARGCATHTCAKQSMHVKSQMPNLCSLSFSPSSSLPRKRNTRPQIRSGSIQ
jgi:hypothetical protein